MIRIVSRICLISLLMSGWCPAQESDAPSLEIVIPQSNLKDYPASRVRLGGNTDPGSSVLVDDEKVHVFPTGAFVTMQRLDVGENVIEVRAQRDGKSTTKKLTVVRKPSVESTPEDVLEIEEEMMLPSEEIQLLPGDILEVQFKGTPGGKATFSIGPDFHDLPMIEDRSSWLDGVYTGMYRIMPGDRVDSQPVEFVLEVPALGELKKQSESTVSIMPRQWPKVGEVTDDWTGLAAGLGRARLGGAELGYLQQGTRLLLDGKVGRMYRVRLSASKHGWVDERALEILPAGTQTPGTHLGRATLESVERADLFITNVEHRVPVLVDAQMNPPRLEVNLFSSTSNLTWVTQNPPTKMIQSFNWQQVEDGHLRLVFQLRRAPIWGYSAEYVGGSNRLAVTVRHPLDSGKGKPLDGIAVAIDAGHGGSNRGALGCLGTMEKDVNLAVSRQLRDRLINAGAQVVFIRSEDEEVEASDRILNAIHAGADLFISVHANSVPLAADPLNSLGAGVFYRHEAFSPLALCLYESLVGLGQKPDGVVSSFNAAVVKRTHIPAVLAEIAYLSHPEEEALLIDPGFQERAALALYEGLERFVREGLKEIDEFGTLDRGQ